jgi:hypothetical protein
VSQKAGLDYTLLRRDDDPPGGCEFSTQLDYSLESGGPGLAPGLNWLEQGTTAKTLPPWIPAFAGTTSNLLIFRDSFSSQALSRGTADRQHCHRAAKITAYHVYQAGGRAGPLSQVEKPVSGYFPVIGFRLSISRRTCENINSIITVVAMIGECQTAIRGFSSFLAGSLPRPRFGRRIASKVLIKNDFSIRGEPRKNFYPELPCAAGKGRARLLRKKPAKTHDRL